MSAQVRRMRDDHGRYRPISRTVLLEGADCGGTRGLGCGRACPLLFRDEWLVPAQQPLPVARSGPRPHALVRSYEQIVEGLDLFGCRDGVTFTPEMRAHTGKRFEILQEVATVYEYDRSIPPIFLPAVDADAFASLEVDRHTVLVDKVVPAPFVDLAAVRAQGDYLALISHKTRGQIRRARRELGTLTTEVAADLPAAFSIYDELVTLHTAQWHAKGQPGAFADPWIDHFHRRLIQQRHHHGEIQLLRVRARGQTIGCTYSMVANGRVYVYQSGFAEFDDPHIKPGYVCHAAGIEYDAAAGHTIYDPLGGDARYKESLSTGSVQLVWLRIQRRLPRFAIERLLRDWKHAREARELPPVSGVAAVVAGAARVGETAARIGPRATAS